jgi:uncharacterized protein YjbI with pentapeptide repeats
MKINYSNENLQGKQFTAANLQNANFHGADLRGADFTSANLNGADFSQSKPGIKFSSRIFLFILALLVSCFSGYIAMLAGHAVQTLLKSNDNRENIAGYITIAFALIFAAVALWKGVFNAINKLFPVMIAIPVLLGAFMYFSGLGTGVGAFYSALALLLMVLMFIVGTIARATVGTMGSNILFLIVAVGGATFGRSLGGGLGTVVMALSCAVISKRALKVESNSLLRKIALVISTKFGTSFKNADLTNANFSDAQIKNTNFSHAILTGVNWTNSQKQFTLETHDK